MLAPVSFAGWPSIASLTEENGLLLRCCLNLQLRLQIIHILALNVGQGRKHNNSIEAHSLDSYIFNPRGIADAYFGHSFPEHSSEVINKLIFLYFLACGKIVVRFLGVPCLDDISSLVLELVQFEFVEGAFPIVHPMSLRFVLRILQIKYVLSLSLCQRIQPLIQLQSSTPMQGPIHIQRLQVSSPQQSPLLISQVSTRSDQHIFGESASYQEEGQNAKV